MKLLAEVWGRRRKVVRREWNVHKWKRGGRYVQHHFDLWFSSKQLANMHWGAHLKPLTSTMLSSVINPNTSKFLPAALMVVVPRVRRCDALGARGGVGEADGVGVAAHAVQVPAAHATLQ